MIRSLFSIFRRNISDKSLWLSFIAGLFLVFSYAPFSQWWLPFIVLPLWFNHLIKVQKSIVHFNNENGIQEEKSNRSRNRIITKHSFIFAFGWFASGISWVHVSIDKFGGMPLVISLLLMLLLCIYLALFPALAGYFTSRLSKAGKLNLWLLPSLWLISEYLRGMLLTGFPWLSLGYTQLNSPLAGLAPIIGEVGITMSLLLICVALCQLIQKTKDLTTGIIIILFSGCIFIANQMNWITQTGETVKVALIQGNIEQEMKWQPDQEWPTMLKYLELSRANYDADLIVWPESAVPSLETLVSTQEFLDMVNSSAALNNSTIITGIQNYNFESKQYFNGLIVLGNQEKKDSEITSKGDYVYNSANRYYKNHLLPIGEFVPLGDFLRPLAPFFNLPMSSFSRGDYVQTNLRANSLNILPLICFEIAFAEQLAANFTDETQLLLTVSNDAWFGNSHGPHQHMEIAQMRALEFGRPLLRATNNGVTAVTDHLGNIIESIPQFEQKVLKADVNLVSGKTPYSQYWQFIHWLLPIIFLLFSLLYSRNRS